MRSSSFPILVFACAGLAQVQSAHADMLRCGSVLISPGDSAGRVIDQCGQPASKMTINTPVFTLGANGTSYPTGNTQSELWRYTFGTSKFPALVRITDGVVESITFEKSHG